MVTSHIFGKEFNFFYLVQTAFFCMAASVQKMNSVAAKLLLLMLTLALLPSEALANTSPGGSGRLSKEGVCIATKSKQVPLVCGDVVVDYKITTLMGDALGAYGLSWKLTRIAIANADGHNESKLSTVPLYGLGAIPKILGDAAQGIELSLYGAAIVTELLSSGNRLLGRVVALQFNTGLGVRPNGGMSFNVPDGYSWDNFLIYARTGGGSQWACSNEKPVWVTAADAKNLMREGLELHGLQVCPQTTVDVSKVERAITAFCSANPNHTAHFCPKGRNADKDADKGTNGNYAADPFAALDKPALKAPDRKSESDPFAVLDQQRPKTTASPRQDMASAFEAAEAQRIASIERKRKFDAVSAACKQDMARQESCGKDTCKAEPAKEACIRAEWGRTSCTPRPGASCLNFPTETCLERGPNPAHAKWEACLHESAATCATQGKRITSVEACITERLQP